MPPPVVGFVEVPDGAAEPLLIAPDELPLVAPPDVGLALVDVIGLAIFFVDFFFIFFFIATCTSACEGMMLV
jgi:hypothetical protein